jgi:hypothetical protein
MPLAIFSPVLSPGPVFYFQKNYDYLSIIAFSSPMFFIFESDAPGVISE